MFDVVLALNGVSDIVEPLKVNKRFQSVSLGEAIDKTGTMLEYATNEMHTPTYRMPFRRFVNVNPTGCHIEMPSDVDG